MQSAFLKSVLDQNCVVTFTRRIVAPGCAVMLGHVIRSDTKRYCEKLPLPARETGAKFDRVRFLSSSVDPAPTSIIHGMRLKLMPVGPPGTVPVRHRKSTISVSTSRDVVSCHLDHMSSRFT